MFQDKIIPLELEGIFWIIYCPIGFSPPVGYDEKREKEWRYYEPPHKFAIATYEGKWNIIKTFAFLDDCVDARFDMLYPEN